MKIKEYEDFATGIVIIFIIAFLMTNVIIGLIGLTAIVYASAKLIHSEISKESEMSVYYSLENKILLKVLYKKNELKNNLLPPKGSVIMLENKSYVVNKFIYIQDKENNSFNLTVDLKEFLEGVDIEKL